MFSKITETMGQLATNKKFLVILAVTIILIGVAFYVYNTYVAPKLNPDFVENKEFVEKDQDISEAYLYSFCVDWCPYCKKAKPVLEKLRDKYMNQKINGIQLNVDLKNVTEDESDVNDFEEKYKVKIDGYPSIFLVKGDEVIEYDAKPEEKTMEEFLQTAL